jgi:hypothetical protein
VRGTRCQELRDRKHPRNWLLGVHVYSYAMFRNLGTLGRLLAREEGDTMSQVVWSVGFILLVGAIAVVIGPEIGADWREFVGKPTR